MSGIWIILVIIIISALPVIGVYLWFRIAKYQFSLVRFLFVLLAGAAAFIPALILQDILTTTSLTQGRMALLYEFFFRIAFTEEISRLLMLIIFYLISGIFTKPKTDDELSRDNLSRDSLSHDTISHDALSQQPTFNFVKKGTAIGLVAGLGFALLESARYASSSMDTFLLLSILRIFSAFPLHAACGSRIGAAVVMFRRYPTQALLRVITATAIHGVYNFLLFMPPGISTAAAILIAISAFIMAILTVRGGWTNDSTLDKTSENI